VADTATGLVWLQYADCLTATTPADAEVAAAALADGLCGLADGSRPGDWQLPTWAELTATIAPAAAGGCGSAAVTGLLPLMTESERRKCFQQLEEKGGDLYPAIASVVFLSGEGGPGRVAWLPFIGKGDSSFVGAFGQGFTLRVWPVRGLRSGLGADQANPDQRPDGPAARERTPEAERQHP
jgi:hypothetical protein